MRKRHPGIINNKAVNVLLYLPIDSVQSNLNNHFMKCILFFLIVVFNSVSIFPFPIEPVPLRKLVMTSEFIVVGYVETFCDLRINN